MARRQEPRSGKVGYCIQQGPKAMHRHKVLSPFTIIHREIELIKIFSLANMMLYTSIAVFFSRFEMELYETTAADMEIIDQFAPIIQGLVKVKITADRWRG